MNVQRLIELLSLVEDKNKPVFIDWDSFEDHNPKDLNTVEDHSERIILTDFKL